LPSLEIPVMSNGNWYMGDFLEFFIWLSMDHSKDNSEITASFSSLTNIISFFVTTSFSY
jgi:hypothetical protein